MKNYKHLLFDLDDTIFDFQKQEKHALEKACNELCINFNENLCNRYNLINKKLWHERSLGQIDLDTVKIKRFELIINEFNIKNVSACDLSFTYVEKLRSKAFELGNSYHVLKTLKNKGYKLHLITNGITKTQEVRLESAKICHYFDNIFISESIGFVKPQIEFFDYVKANVAEFNCNQALVIGDSLTTDILAKQC